MDFLADFMHNYFFNYSTSSTVDGGGCDKTTTIFFKNFY